MNILTSGTHCWSLMETSEELQVLDSSAQTKEITALMIWQRILNYTILEWHSCWCIAICFYLAKLYEFLWKVTSTLSVSSIPVCETPPRAGMCPLQQQTGKNSVQRCVTSVEESSTFFLLLWLRLKKIDFKSLLSCHRWSWKQLRLLFGHKYSTGALILR